MSFVATERTDIVSHQSVCIADVVSVHTLGHLTLVVNTLEAAKEMFERRSAIYSDRPWIPMINMCVQIVSLRVYAIK